MFFRGWLDLVNPIILVDLFGRALLASSRSPEAVDTVSQGWGCGCLAVSGKRENWLSEWLY